MVAMAANGVDGEVTKEFIIAAQSVCYIAELLSKMNFVFILQTRTMQPCHSALCQHVHEKLEKPYSEHEVTLEPLVDWMTIDPVADVTPLWFTLFRRNKSLLHKFALTNSKFVPRKPVRFCLECLSFIAEERNLVWCIIKEEPDIIYADVPMPWPMADSNNDGQKSEHKGGNKSEEPWSSDSDSCTSEETVTTSMPAAEHEPQTIPNVDGPFDLKPRFRKFEIWRDNSTQALQLPLRAANQTHPFALQERQRTNMTGWTPINAPNASTTPSSYEPVQLSVDSHITSPMTRYKMDPPADIPFQGTFAMSEAEKYPAARAGFPNGPAQEYQHKPGISFRAAPMEDYGPIHVERPIADSVYESQADADGSTDEEVYNGNERHFGDELDPNLDTIVRVQGDPSLEPLPDLETTESAIEPTESDLGTTESDINIPESNPEAAETLADVAAPTLHTPHNAFKHGSYTWPAPKESASPIPARPAPGFDITPENLYPHPNQLICSCRGPAKTETVRIVQCRNTECFVRWYHYACLKDKREKGVARFGTLLCELCKGEEYWKKAQGVTDLSMPFSQKEVVDGIMNQFGTNGAGDPYGLGGSKVHDHANEVNETEN
ncbi:hypothetical protein P171DRAFT_51970 [Karstenula rhodostoma CBS 690.94]|uniref:Zinc finger PHD-type domain-containing protein n=1 Tax=Karstenula rhodostoma CBS 690.94 TaxID=1392251 RepID=A0A9P4PDA3_9PLEO|nr:hypothetical protein P171DRAFT_51970 [Karstenula rhodostoma CBS 690.94]